MTQNYFFNKTMLSKAVGMAIGLSAVSIASADQVISFELIDFNTDGLQSDFAFAAPPSGSGPLKIGGGVVGETGCINAADGNNCDPIIFGSFASVGTDTQGSALFQVGVFTTGFNFGGQGPFNPNISAPDGMADINATIDPVLAETGNGLALQFGALELGGVYSAGGTVPGLTSPGQNFYLAADHLTNCTGAAPGLLGAVCGSVGINDTNPILSNPAGYNVSISSLGGGEYGVVVKYIGTIGDNPANPDPSGGFVGQDGNWRLEGVMTIEDNAPIVTVNGADPLSHDPNVLFVDPGATCFDAVDGAIASTGPGLPSFVVTDNNAFTPNTGPDGSNFTVTYTCTDSANQGTVEMRTVEVGVDTEAPVITLLEPGSPTAGRSDSGMGAIVDILVDVPYVDAGATCLDNTGDIPLGTTGPGTRSFTVDDDTVDTGSEIQQFITFTCDDAAGNGPEDAVRTVNVIADNILPVIVIPADTETVIVTKGNEYIDPGATCTDANPVDAGAVLIPLGTVGQPGFTVTPDPDTIDTDILGDTTLLFECVDAAGNPAVDIERVVSVVGGLSFNILSMTISDLDGDQIAGCFRFNSLDVATCDLAHRFSSDDSVVTGFTAQANITLPGTGTDLDGSGNPIGIRFGVFQDIGEMSPGFNFSGFPFVPFTFDPPSAAAVPPAGVVTVVDEAGGLALADFSSFPWGGLFDSNTPNEFFMPPDPGTLNIAITSINGDDDGITRTFDYFMSWTHVITAAEDPTGAFVNFNSFWRLEGKITADSTVLILNNPPEIVSLRAAQGANDPTVHVTGDGVHVLATVDANDPDGDGLNFDWSGSDARLVPLAGTTNPGFTFDPSGLADGIYQLAVTVTDDAASPLASSAQLLINIFSVAIDLGPGDSDGDGIPDDVEGFGDDDDDHLPNFHDAINGFMSPGVNRVDFSDALAGDVVSNKGKLQLGDTAFAAGNDIFTVSEADIARFGAPAGTPVDNAEDRLNRVDGLGHSGGIFDFRVTGLIPGEAVRVVLPQSAPLPAQPQYRLYTPASGWKDYVVASGNELASTLRVAGACPGPDDAAYDDNLRLVQGDDCVRLTIVDGGVNDRDAERNGIVVDPGVVLGNGPVAINDGGGGGGGCSLAPVPTQVYQKAEWPLIMGFLAWMGWRRRKRLQ